MNVIALPKLVTETQAAQMLQCSTDTLARARGTGKLRFRRMGNGRGRIRYTEADLLDYLNRCEENGWHGEADGRDSLDPTGSASDQTAINGAALGSRLDKPAASRLAHRTFRKPANGSLTGMWRTAPPATNDPQASGSRS